MVSLVYFKNVSKAYNGSLILDNITFKIDPGEFVSLVGRSGVGKTTLLKMLLKEESPTKGRIFFDDKDVNKFTNQDITFLRRKIGMVFQDFKLLTQKTAYENVAFAMEVAGYPEKMIEKDAPELLKLVNLEGRANNFPYQLSAGEKQRVVIARVLAQRPELILADEPTGDLDPINTWDIIKLLTKINELGTAIILATHNKEVINTLGRRVISLDDGKIIRDEEEGRYLI
ncbi:MAG: ATP-binding cassette domain-containing protein [Candidatus Pacebacteria bacterium]|nr:ATP-binding cassette domain-containing protein [Candidatus Paceibacterota bacterium]MDD4994760.1 ATP-binding cassette domain-containing protein [Candidatus Paceibacterota bacterium]MDD5535465.1 ATP-binding cassette domain-containing protein [Candidatus Paceibacterota bacterium]